MYCIDDLIQRMNFGNQLHSRLPQSVDESFLMMVEFLTVFGSNCQIVYSETARDLRRHR